MRLFNLLIVLLFAVLSFQPSSGQSIIWSEPEMLAPSDYGNYYPRIVANETGDIFVSWGGGNNVYFVRKQQDVFSAVQKINPDSIDVYVANWTGADIAVQGEVVYIVYMHSTWGKKSYIQRSDNGGQSFQAPRLIENYPDSSSRFPTLTIDQNGNPVVAIMKMTTQGEHPHYVVRKSEDKGENFISETLASNWSGLGSESCDCCPAALGIKDSMVVLSYRDNLHDVREVWASLSLDGGRDFTSGFKIDSSDWVFPSCPSSGPDVIIVEDKLYSVFMSNDECYLSQMQLQGDQEISISSLKPGEGSYRQNFPRIDANDETLAMIWFENNRGPRMIFSTKQLNSDDQFTRDTLMESFFYSADLVVHENTVHVVWADNPTGTVHYLKGEFAVSNQQENESRIINISPNPLSNKLNLDIEIYVGDYSIFNSSGILVQKGPLKSTINISNLNNGLHYIDLIDRSGESHQTSFVKY